MAIRYDSLDQRTRDLMAQELDRDSSDGTLYVSPRLTDEGQQQWPELLREAILSHDDDWLASELRSKHLIRDTEQRKKPKGGFTTAKVPVTAPDTLSEGEFNRFYARGTCARAVADGVDEVEVYRGKSVENPRSASQAMIGKRIPANALLDDLRTSQGVEPALGLPPGPNSGLTVRLADGV